MNKPLTLASAALLLAACGDKQATQEQQKQEPATPRTPSVTLANGLEVRANKILAASLASVTEARLTICTHKVDCDDAEYISARETNPATKQPRMLTIATALPEIAKLHIGSSGSSSDSFTFQIDNQTRKHDADKGLLGTCHATPPGQRYAYTCDQIGRLQPKQPKARKQTQVRQKILSKQ